MTTDMTKDSIIVCDDCKGEFFVKAVKIERQHIVVRKRDLWLDYFVCPHCGKLYKVCLMDKRFFKMVDDLQKTRRQAQRHRGNANRCAPLIGMAQAKQQKVHNHVECLEKQYPGTFVLDEMHKLIYREKSAETTN